MNKEKALRSFRSRLGLGVLALFLFGASLPAWANGNVSADEPVPAAPIKKAVRRAPVPKRRTAPKKKKAAPKPAPKPRKRPVRRPAAPKVTSLQKGIALMHQERYRAAFPWLQKAVQEERRNPDAWYWFGMVHDKTGRFYEAQYFYSKAVEIDPTFDPLSRVVIYPNEGGKTPLWDPRRPARVYAIPTDEKGMAVIPPDSPQSRRRPTRPPIDPALPKVPAYVPPEAGAVPSDGDAWQPSVYVPPTADSVLEGGEPVYIPPESQAGAVPGPAELLPAESPMESGYPPAPLAPAVRGAPIEEKPVYEPPLPQELQKKPKVPVKTRKKKTVQPAKPKKNTPAKPQPQKAPSYEPPLPDSSSEPSPGAVVTPTTPNIPEMAEGYRPPQLPQAEPMPAEGGEKAPDAPVSQSEAEPVNPPTLPEAPGQAPESEPPQPLPPVGERLPGGSDAPVYLPPVP